MDFIIRNGRIDDADFLAVTVMEAVGEELIDGLAGTPEKLPKVHELFRRLAARSDSQYSYKNALIAVSDDNKPIGAIIGYDGANLKMLRKAFISEANDLLEWNMTPEEEAQMKDEASPDEAYLDSLYVIPSCRGNGIATALFRAAFEKFGNIGKPFGLLVEPSNERAKRLYEQLGFKDVRISDFFGTPMIHMQK
ncbi:MAG: GNAT family N-acetyltransferase [Paramuribaculum sp.]|nr:GNAT family N-acetyltransferase [Paramuribaculum sp.]